MNKVSIGIVLHVVWVGVAHSGPADFPSSVTMHHQNSSGVNSIMADCKRRQGGGISCTFSQISIHNKVKPDDAKKYAMDERKKFFTMADEQIKNELEGIRNSDSCNPVKIEKALITNRQREGYANFVREYAGKDVELMKDLCNSTSKEEAARVIGNIAEREANKCTFVLNSWTQNFEYDYQNEKWISKKGPDGECGVLNISSLSQYQTKVFDISLDWWRYTTRRVVTSPEAKGMLDALGSSCEDLDESVQIYDQFPENGKEKVLSCIVIGGL